jgi:hypothetical protein
MDETLSKASAVQRRPVTGEVAAGGGRGEEARETSEPAKSREKVTDTAENGEDIPGLSESDQKEVQKLEKRDAEVRAHEAAHLAAAGQYAAGGMSLDYQRGPDGRQYAVGGDVSIDVSAARTPEATIAKMQVVRQAALAPASPSGQDRKVAAEAAQKESAARQKLSEEAGNETEPVSDTAMAKGAHPERSEVEGVAAGLEPTKEKPSGLAAIRNQSKIAGAMIAYGAPSATGGTLDWAM